MLKIRYVSLISLLCLPQNISLFGSQTKQISNQNTPVTEVFLESVSQSVGTSSLHSFSSSALQAATALATVSETESKIKQEHLMLKYTIKSQKLDAVNIKKIESTIGYQFKDKKLLIQALTTRAKDLKKNYERYEYFGDTVLELMITKMLLHEYPNASEGDLTCAGSSLVRQEALAALCLRLGLYKYIQDTRPIIPISSLCDIIESTVGAIYEDGGEKAAQEFAIRFFLPMIQGKGCPQQMAKIIRTAAQEIQENITYRLKKNKKDYMLVKSPGTGVVTKPQSQKKGPKNQTKADPKRLALYLAEKDFITKNLDKKYQENLVRLAIDLGYQSLQKMPILKLSWNMGKKANFRVRLHTLMQMLGHKIPTYVFQENNESAEKRFTCTLACHPFKPAANSAPTKAEAEETVAETVYKQIQKTVLVTEDFMYDAKKAIDALDPKDPVTSLNVLCQKLGLQAPTYISYFKEKNNAVALYTCLNAPWLTTEIRGTSCATVNESKAAAARKLISLIQHVTQGYIEPKRVQFLHMLGDTNDPVSALNTLCQTCALEQPKVETHLCEGPVSDGLLFQTVMTVADKHWGNKIIAGEKASSKVAAEKSTAAKILRYLANKMFEEELTPAQS